MLWLLGWVSIVFHFFIFTTFAPQGKSNSDSPKSGKNCPKTETMTSSWTEMCSISSATGINFWGVLELETFLLVIWSFSYLAFNFRTRLCSRIRWTSHLEIKTKGNLSYNTKNQSCPRQINSANKYTNLPIMSCIITFSSSFHRFPAWHVSWAELHPQCSPSLPWRNWRSRR